MLVTRDNHGKASDTVDDIQPVKVMGLEMDLYQSQIDLYIIDALRVRVHLHR